MLRTERMDSIKSYQILYGYVPADDRMKVKMDEKRDKYMDFARKRFKKYRIDGDCLSLSIAEQLEIS